MTKHIKIRIDRISKCKDKKYVHEIADSMIESLHDFPTTASKIGIFRDTDTFIVKFDLKISKTGDLLWILIKEFLSCIRQTEDEAELSISEIEDGETGVTYKLYNYIPNKENCC